jgi:hypothetical protein
MNTITATENAGTNESGSPNLESRFFALRTLLCRSDRFLARRFSLALALLIHPLLQA